MMVTFMKWPPSMAGAVVSRAQLRRIHWLLHLALVNQKHHRQLLPRQDEKFSHWFEEMNNLLKFIFNFQQYQAYQQPPPQLNALDLQEMMLIAQQQKKHQNLGQNSGIPCCCTQNQCCPNSTAPACCSTIAAMAAQMVLQKQQQIMAENSSGKNLDEKNKFINLNFRIGK